MKLWIDISNSPHVLFFRSLIARFRPAEVFVTARDFGPIRKLLDAEGIDFRLVGKHGGSYPLNKLVASARRTETLAKLVERWGPDVCVHKYSVEGARVALGLGIPTVAIADNELAGAQNVLTLPFADTVVLPKAVGGTPLGELAVKRLVEFDGVCEVAHAIGFRPDSEILDRLGLSPEKPLAVLRPQPYEAAYLRGKPDCTGKLISKLNRQNDDLQIVLLPRTAQDNKYGKMENVRVLPEPVDSLSLIAQADLVVSGGGTMNREAAVLGTPSICCFPGGLMAVNKYLVQKGLMTYATPRQLVERVNLKVEKVSDRKRPKGLRSPIPLINSELKRLAK